MDETTTLQDDVIAKLKTIFDPEIPVNIYDLGLIYGVDVADDNFVSITMTLTTPGCPVAQTFPQLIQDNVLQVENVSGCKVELVWEPPWNQNMMTDEAKLQLGML